MRDLAAKHKEREEKRIRRRVLLGLDEEKVEENLVQDHKQTNLTASLMMNGSKKSKYSWMQSSSTTSNSSFNSHGDNGIRYREAREEQSVVLRDLIAALENRRIGASNALLKASLCTIEGLILFCSMLYSYYLYQSYNLYIIMYL